MPLCLSSFGVLVWCSSAPVLSWKPLSCSLFLMGSWNRGKKSHLLQRLNCYHLFLHLWPRAASCSKSCFYSHRHSLLVIFPATYDTLYASLSFWGWSLSEMLYAHAEGRFWLEFSTHTHISGACEGNYSTFISQSIDKNPNLIILRWVESLTSVWKLSLLYFCYCSAGVVSQKYHSLSPAETLHILLIILSDYIFYTGEE